MYVTEKKTWNIVYVNTNAKKTMSLIYLAL